MFSNNSNRSRAAPARGFVALCAMLAMGLGLLARPAEAAPFAYITNEVSNSVSVIDTATNTVLTGPGFPLAVGRFPFAVAVTPDGKHAYVTNADDNTVSVIDTATNTVEAATLAVGTLPIAVAVTPDGTHAYVANEFSNSVSVIDTATNTVEAATLAVGNTPEGVAVTPDGKHAYVTNFGSANVSVIDTATNTVEPAALAVGNGPIGVAVTPDGTHAYVTNQNSNSVSVIDTATNTVEAATLAVGNTPVGVAVTPDGNHAYVVNEFSNSVSVIDTAANAVELATLAVGNGPLGVGIVPPPPGVPFLAFNVALAIDLETAPNTDTFNLQSQITLSSTAPAINPLTDAVTLQAGTFAITIPPGSFKKQSNGSFTFAGTINGVSLRARIKPTGTLRYAFNASATGASLTGSKNPVYVTLIIGGDSGATSDTAFILP